MARRQEELRPYSETQIGRLHSRRLVFVAEVVERSHHASPPQCSLGWRSLDRNTLRASGGQDVLRANPIARAHVPKIRCTHTNRCPA